ncbi:hypothetical protein F5B17DRAFT_13567 [Nemania serpens]|nr:hypothetical protein F5B17DRAFT_13567 [Nemania serpens]
MNISPPYTPIIFSPESPCLIALYWIEVSEDYHGFDRNSQSLISRYTPQCMPWVPIHLCSHPVDVAAGVKPGSLISDLRSIQPRQLSLPAPSTASQHQLPMYPLRDPARRINLLLWACPTMMEDANSSSAALRWLMFPRPFLTGWAETIVRILQMFLAVRKCLPSCSRKLDGSESKTSLCWQCVLLKDILLSGTRDMIRVETRRFHAKLQRRCAFSLELVVLGSVIMSKLEGVASRMRSSTGTHLELESKFSACPVLSECGFSNAG